MLGLRASRVGQEYVDQFSTRPPKARKESFVLLKAIKHRIEYGAAAIAIGAIGLAGIDTSASVFAWISRTIGPRTRRHQRSLRNLAIAFPERSPEELNTIALEMWDNMGRVAAELILVDRMIADPSRIAIAETPALEEAVEKRAPQIGVTLHSGNWELVIWPVRKFGGAPGGVYRPLANPHIDRMIRSRRESLFSGGLFAKGKEEGPKAAKVLIDFVRGGGWLGFVCDHVDRRGIEVDFLGQSTRVTHVPSLIARHTSARVWIARAIRDGKKSRFRIDIKEIELPSGDDKRADSHLATRRIVEQFEAWIREYPEQWQWWNIRPLGDR
jgi:KDO2-lipid IV(A) lauroyltransferase